MTNDELQNLVQKISQQDFKRSFKHQAMFNARLRTTGGRYILKTHNLEFNPKMISVPEFEAIIKHELVHYHLHLMHKGYRHADQDFKTLLAHVGGIRYAPKLATSQHYWHYQCENRHDIFRIRRFQVAHYRCRQCGGRLQLINRT